MLVVGLHPCPVPLHIRIGWDPDLFPPPLAVWEGAERIYYPAAWLVVISLGWIAFRVRAHRDRVALIPMICLVGLLSLVVMRAGNASLAQSMGTIIACGVWFVLFQLWRGGVSMAAAWSGVSS